MSIPQTYLIDSSPGENDDADVFIAHLLSGVLFIPGHALLPEAARTPTHQGERQLMLDRQSCQALVFPETTWLLQQAS
jgi:hypothetical protein